MEPVRPTAAKRSFMATLMAATVRVATAGLSSPLFAGTSDGADMTHVRQAATEAFRSGQYAQAYRRYAELADAGDGAAALIALTMVCLGPSLFGASWSATPGQLRRWRSIAMHEVAARSPRIAEHDRGE